VKQEAATEHHGLILDRHTYKVRVAEHVLPALVNAWRFAKQHDLLRTSARTGFLDVLDRMSECEWKYTLVGVDFAPHSFNFTMCGMYGGMLYHGPHDGGGDGSAPTFSVNISPVVGWSLHT